MSNKVSVVNSFMLAGLIGISAWVCNKVVDMNASLAAINALKEQEMAQIREIKETLTDLKSRVSDTVTRQEFQQRLQQMEQRLTQIEMKFRP